MPPYGGDTLWASSTAAYEALSAPLRRLLDGLTATHDIGKSFPRERFGVTEADLARLEEARLKNPPRSHPVVRTHPVTGRKCLFVSDGFTTPHQRTGAGRERCAAEVPLRPCHAT
ncbi:taurine dioxygenase [Pseudomonas aeruginosa]|nr:taurine dioxygenase [Pseudomonas aeruginosa]